MLFVWMLLSVCVGLTAGIAGTYMYLDNKFEKTVKDVLNDAAEQLAQFADE
nr:MAG TPA: Bacterial virulence factor hemolysin [Caudoviricetes sp.]